MASMTRSNHLKSYRIGSGREADVRLGDADQGVSRIHAELLITADGRLFLTDCFSTNGTFLPQGNHWRPFRQGYVNSNTRVRFGTCEVCVADIVDRLEVDPSRAVRRNPATGEIVRVA